MWCCERNTVDRREVCSDGEQQRMHVTTSGTLNCGATNRSATNRSVIDHGVADRLICNDGVKNVFVFLKLIFNKFKSLQGSSCVSACV
jgi:hypothetical protein